MEVARTEIFGPVLSVMPFENEEEAIKIANDTPYGLTNYIQTQDKEKVKSCKKVKIRNGRRKWSWYCCRCTIWRF